MKLALISVSAALSTALSLTYFAYFRLLMKVNQPVAEGTDNLWKVVLGLLFCQSAVTILGLQRKWNSQWPFLMFPFLILLSLTGAIYFQWFMVSVKGYVQ
jgi:hypothetical protein